MEGAPLGWPHRQKENGRSISPAWSFARIETPHEQPFRSGRLSVYNSPHPLDFDYQRGREQYHAHNPHPVSEHLLSTPDASNALAPGSSPTYPAGPSTAAAPLQPLPRSPRVDNMAAHISRRFPGDGFDYRRPVGSRTDEAMGAEVDHGNNENDDNDNYDENEEDESGNSILPLGSGDDRIIDLTADDSGYGASQEGNNISMRNVDLNPHPPFRIRRAPSAVPRLPRGMDVIIDLDSGREEWREVTLGEPGSPEIEFISARVRPRAPRDPQRQSDQWLRENQDGDEVQFVREQVLPENDVRRRRNENLDHVLGFLGTINGSFPHIQAQVERLHTQLTGQAVRLGHGPIAPPRAGSSRRDPRHHGNIRMGHFVQPALDFVGVGFPIGEARPPTYLPPSDAPEGFTRSPEEKDILICPHCNEELCTGDDEVKRQVWIVKGCGHVYCGECTANRSIRPKRSAKGKERTVKTDPFKSCVVEDCGKNVSNRRSMIQVFL